MIEEFECWDKCVKKKDVYRDDIVFCDYQCQLEKFYKCQFKSMGVFDVEKYICDKMVVIEKVVVEGMFEIVEMEDGEMIVVDKDGMFFSMVDLMDFV